MAQLLHMPGKDAMGWKCSFCGELITRIKDGWVEWLAGEDQSGRPFLKGLRLVHRTRTTDQETDRLGCQYDARHEFRKDRSVVEGLSLERFVGPDGLMMFLSLISVGEMPTGEILELMKRVQIPGYEQTRELLQEAVGQGVVVPSIGEGFYMQSEMRALLRHRPQSTPP
jgi:hypothetical protein